MSDYFNVTTNVGDAAIATAIANNSKLNITHIAFGDGNGSVPTPTKTRTSLVREVHRQAVTKYTMHPTIANYIVIETIIPSNIGGFWIREMGIIADNVLISHGSHAPFFKVVDPDGVSEYRLKFTQNVREGNVVEISLDESLIYASQAWVNENYIRRNELVDNLTTNDAKKPLSAKQGQILDESKLNNVLEGGDGVTDLEHAQLIAIGEDVGRVYPSGLTWYQVDRKLGLLVGMTGTPYVVKKEKNKASTIVRILTENDNAPSASRFATPRNIFGQTFDGSGDVGGTITASTGLVQASAFHFIDMGRNGLDRMSFYNFGATFNFIDSENGNVVARITQNGIDCNAASASKLKTSRKINGVNFDGTTDIDLPLIGIGQTWQDVSALRLDGVTYTNTSPRTITVFFGGGRQGVPAAEFHVGDEIFARWGGGSEPDEVYFSLPIPPGGTYGYKNKPQYSYVFRELK